MAGIEKSYSKIACVVASPTSVSNLNQQSALDQDGLRVSQDVVDRPSNSQRQRVVTNSSRKQLSMTQSMGKTDAWLDIVQQQQPSTETFRVQTASAVNITRSINRMRVSQRLADI